MFPARAEFYWQWRSAQHAVSSLRETDTPPEQLVQNIWHHQRLRREELRLLDGRTVRVLHPGFWNHGAGPDFRGAIIQFDRDPPVSGETCRANRWAK